MHELAKQRIRQRRELLLPALDVAVSETDAFGQLVKERVHIRDSRRIHLDACSTDRKFGEATVDVAGRIGERDILVEITVFHRLMPEKLARLISLEIPALQIDLSQFKVRQATRSKLEAAIFENENNRHWLYHPLIEDARQQAKTRLNAKLEGRRKEWADREATRAAQAELAKKQQESSPQQLLLQSASRRPRTSFILSTLSPEVGPIWRASLPPLANVQHACQDLSKRTGLNPAAINKVICTVTRRSQLATMTPVELAGNWATMLAVPEAEIFQFFHEAGYTLIS